MCFFNNSKKKPTLCEDFQRTIYANKKYDQIQDSSEMGKRIKGSKNPTSDAVEKHVTSEMHKYAADLALKKELGPKEYVQNIHQNTAIGKSITRMHEKTRKVMENHFSTAYYLAKNEKPFNDFPKLLDLQKLNGLDVHMQLELYS